LMAGKVQVTAFGGFRRLFCAHTGGAEGWQAVVGIKDIATNQINTVSTRLGPEQPCGILPVCAWQNFWE